ncbi:MAG: SLC13 family permease [Paracoccaceae bacterium]|nr:SLC13 family permease [Paracoccaceae bacterium]
MTFDVIFVLAVLSVAVVVISLELIAIDVAAMAMIVAVVAVGILTPAEALSGFSSEVVIALACIFVIAGTVSRAGLAEAATEAILRRGKGGNNASLAIVMGLSVMLSTVLSNTSTSSVLTPGVIHYAKRTATSASRLLMPMAFASLMGGTMTLIGTSTNLSASGMIDGLGLEPYRFFEFFVVGGIVAICGTVFMVFIGRRLIPDRRPLDLVEDYGVRDYLAELTLGSNSSAVGAQITELDLGALELEPLAVIRNGVRLSAHPLRTLQASDRLIVRGSLDGLLRARDDKRFDIETSAEQQQTGLRPDDIGLGEAVVMPNSRLVGRPLGQTSFFRRYRVVVLAVHRKGRAFATKLSALRVQAGDVLLLQGANDDLEMLNGNPDLWGLTEVGPPRPTIPQGLFALGLLVVSVALASLGILPLAMGLLGAVVILALTGTVPVQEAYRMIDWRLLVMVAGMTGFGLAMFNSGAADVLAKTLVGWVAPFGITASLLALGALTIVLTQPMSNAAAALTMLPVAVSTAGLLGIDPRPAAVMVTLSASLSFIAPLEPALLLVYGPGRYRFIDFLRVGGPLTLLTLFLLVMLIPVFWPLG